MNVVVLSGKGGTGKTTTSINLARVAGAKTALLDCDVEEPNSHLFVAKDFDTEIDVHSLYPEILESRCIHCGKCGDFCNFNAILNLKKSNIIMPEMCHDCGGCKIVCPVDAISYKKRSIGRVRVGEFGKDQIFVDGILNTGEFSATNIIKEVLSYPTNSGNRIIDAPPGSACAAVEATAIADIALIVTEPTPFALSDMKMVVDMLKKLRIPTVVFINKSDSNDSDVLSYCRDENLRVVGSLPFSLEYGKSLAKGEILADMFPEAKDVFVGLWDNLLMEVENG